MYYDFKVKQTKNFVLFIIVSVILIIAVHAFIEAGLSCVSSDGCLRYSCNKNWLNDDY